MSKKSNRLTPRMIEAGCRAMHDCQGTGDADAPLHSPYQKSWEEPDSVRWKQWRETIREVWDAMVGAPPETPEGLIEQIARIIEPKAWAYLDSKRKEFPADPIERFYDLPEVEASLSKAGQIMELWAIGE